MVERWNPFAKKRHDLFGCIDMIALDDERCIGVQVTSGAHHAERRAKALNEPRLRAWLKTGCKFEVWSWSKTWSKTGERGKRKVWTLRREPIYVEMLVHA